ncbi:MAG TPA: hypothetical protein VGL81_24560 [Polyangiaceae bacterium]
MKRPRRILAVLKLPGSNVPGLLMIADGIVSKMTGNAFFPAPRPPLATVSSAIAELSQAQVETLSRTTGTVAVRARKRVVLVNLLEELRSYVQATADASREQAASIIESAGMSVKRPRTVYPRVFRAKDGHVSGEVNLEVPSAGDDAGYEWEDSLDGAITWRTLPPTRQASTTVSGLSPGSKVHFRYRAVTKDGPTDWSDSIWIIVQ